MYRKARVLNPRKAFEKKFVARRPQEVNDLNHDLVRLADLMETYSDDDTPAGRQSLRSIRADYQRIVMKLKRSGDL